METMMPTIINIIPDPEEHLSRELLDVSVGCLGLLSDSTPIMINTIPTNVPIIAPTKDATQSSVDLS